MIRALISICLICFVGVIALSFKTDHLDVISEKAATDAALLDDLIARPDRIGWRLTEDLTLKRVILWDSNGRLRYPVQDGFIPLLYEFSEDETRRLNARQSEITAPTWERFDAMGLELLHCHATPSICLIYDRAALEKMFGLKKNTLLSAAPSSLWRPILLIVGAICAGMAIWLIRGSRQRSDKLILVPDRHSAMRGTLEIPLSARDLKLLSLLEAKNGGIVTKDELYDAGWGRDFMPNSRALDQHMINLRRKLDPDKSLPTIIETVHSIGYRLVK